MARFKIPQNIGKVRVAVTSGNRYVVWNGKQGRHEFAIPCRDRKQADAVAKIVNGKQHGGEIDLSAM